MLVGMQQYIVSQYVNKMQESVSWIVTICIVYISPKMKMIVWEINLSFQSFSVSTLNYYI